MAAIEIKNSVSELAFIGGRKIQLILDRYPVVTSPVGRKELWITFKKYLSLDIKDPNNMSLSHTIQEALYKQYLCHDMDTDEYFFRHPKLLKNGSEELDELPTSEILIGLTPSKCYELGRKWQFLLDNNKNQFDKNKLNQLTIIQIKHKAKDYDRA